MSTPVFCYLPKRKAFLNLAHVAFFDAEGNWPEATLAIADSSEEGHPTALVIGLDQSDAAVVAAALQHFAIGGPLPPPETARTHIARSLEGAREAIRAAEAVVDAASTSAPGVPSLCTALRHLTAAVATLGFPEDAEVQP